MFLVLEYKKLGLPNKGINYSLKLLSNRSLQSNGKYWRQLYNDRAITFQEPRESNEIRT